MDRMTNFVLVGVGGQGTLLASNILADVGLAAGFDVKKSEVHGMSQRGGSVVSHVRWHPEHVASPLVGLGEADILLAFEKLEALRFVEFLKPGGTAIVNEMVIVPITVSAGTGHYPDDAAIDAALAAVSARESAFPASASRRRRATPRRPTWSSSAPYRGCSTFPRSCGGSASSSACRRSSSSSTAPPSPPAAPPSANETRVPPAGRRPLGPPVVKQRRPGVDLVVAPRCKELPLPNLGR